MLLSFLLLIALVLEMFSLAILIPVLRIVLDSENLKALIDSFSFLEFLNLFDHQDLILFAMLFLVLVYLFKGLFLLFTSWMQSKFSVRLPEELSKNLFYGYLKQPYVFHLQRNSGHLISNLQTEISQFSSVIQSIISISIELAIVSGLAISLLIIEPFGGVVVAICLLISMLLFNLLTKKKLNNWGQMRQRYDAQISQNLIQSLGGVKEVKLFNKESFFSEQFNKQYSAKSDIYVKQLTLMQLPRLYLEFLAVLSLSVLVSVMVIEERPLEHLLPTIGVFMAAAFRLLPSINKIIASVQNLKFSSSVIDKLYFEHQTVNNIMGNSDPEKKIIFKSILKINNVSFKYPETETDVIDVLNLKIKKGEMIGIIGRSGSGKSTLVDLILGLLNPYQGDVLVDNHDIEKNLKGWYDLVGYVPQNIFLIDDSLCNNIAFGVPQHEINYEIISDVLKAAQLEDFVTQLPIGIETNVGEKGVKLSGGQRQRIGIARALYNNPQILILDEATSALDNATEKDVMTSINSQKGSKTIIIVAHRLSTLKNCDRIISIEKGKIANKG